MFFSVILPAYNEERQILDSIEQLRTQLPSISTKIQEEGLTGFEVIVVNDGSNDRTAKIVLQYINEFPDFALRLIELSKNKGKGYAVKMGVEAATGKYIIFMDVDLSVPLTELPKLIWMLQKNYAIAIGSRGLAQSQIIKHQPIYRELMGKMFNILVRLLVINRIYDTQCGFKAFRAAEAKQIFNLLQTYRFGFDVEILLIAQNMQIPIQEIPVIWRNSSHSSVAPIRDSWEMFWSLIQMKQKIRHNILVNSVKDG